MTCPFCKKDTAEAQCMDYQSIQTGGMIREGWRVVCANKRCGAQGPKRSNKELATVAWKRATEEDQG